MNMKKTVASGLFDDLLLRLTNADKPNSRPIYHIRVPKGAAHSVLSRAR